MLSFVVFVKPESRKGPFAIELFPLRWCAVLGGPPNFFNQIFDFGSSVYNTVSSWCYENGYTFALHREWNDKMWDFS